MPYQYPFLNPDLPLKDRIHDLISRLTIEEKAGFIPTRNQAVERLGIAAFNFGAEGAHGFVNREGETTTFPQTIGLASSWDRELLRKIGEITAVEARAVYKSRDCLGGITLWAPTIDMERDPRWGRTEEGYGEDPYLTGELSSAYIRGAQGDDPFFLRAGCTPKHFLANNNEKNRVDCSCSVTQRCLREYYFAPFQTAVQKAKAVSIMTSYNEVNGIPVMLHPILKDIVKKEWGIEGNLVTDGGDFTQTVERHHYFETHAQTLTAAFKNGADSMTDKIDDVIPAVLEALEKNYITENDLDKVLERIFTVRFRLGHFSPEGLCPYDSIDESDLMKDKYREIARDAVRKSITLLKNDNNILPILPEKNHTIAVIGPLADVVYLDWYSGNPPYHCTPLEGLRNLYGKDAVITADYRGIVSFTTEDGRPLILADNGSAKGKILSVGKRGQNPARFYLEDWGWGSFTLTDTESGLLLDSPVCKKETGGNEKNEECFITASAKSSLFWFASTVFNLVPQENGFLIIKTFDNRRIASVPDNNNPEKFYPARLLDDPSPAAEELFRMSIEKESLIDAIEAAKDADMVIFIGVSNPMINGRECTDRPSLDLPPFQKEFILKAAEVNPNIALVLISGYPYTLNEIAKKIPAVIWMSGGLQETGNGLVDILSGAFSPAGRLPLTWYKDEKDLPSIMEYDIISAETTYQYFKGNVLYPFGYGLSYSSFEYSDIKIDKSSANKDDTVEISFKIRNKGTLTSDEVPQLYVTINDSKNSQFSIINSQLQKRPLKTLKGFYRITLDPNKERFLSFSLPIKELAIWDSYEGRFCIRAGTCKVSIGSSSADIRLKGGFKVLGETFSARKIKPLVYAECFDSYMNCFLHEKRGSAIPAVFTVGKRDRGEERGGREERKNICFNDCAWICFRALDFSSGSSEFSAVVQGTPGSRIEIHLDSPDGKIVGTLGIPNTADLYDYDLPAESPRRCQLWSYAKTSIQKIEGIHDLYLVLYGKTGIWKFMIK